MPVKRQRLAFTNFKKIQPDAVYKKHTLDEIG